jgi:SAM-dependent methyltransferase
MPAEAVGDQLQVQYDEYYGSPELEEWRRLGAFDKVDNIVELCDDLPHDSILDVGCGDGAVMQLLDERDFGRHYHGLEISKSGIEAVSRKRISRLQDVKLFSGYEIPYPDKSFDLAVLTHVIEHVEHPRRLLYEAGRVARLVFVEVPMEHTLRLGQDYVHDPVGHINFYTDKTIRRLLQTSGFEVLKQKLADDSRELLTFQHGRTGLLRHFARRLALRTVPNLAKNLFVYNSALICQAPTDMDPVLRTDG